MVEIFSSHFFFQYILQGYFILLFILFGIGVIGSTFYWFKVVFYIWFKKPKIREKLFWLFIIPKPRHFFFAFNKEDFNDKFISENKKKTLKLIKLALISWLIAFASVLLILLIGIALS